MVGFTNCSFEVYMLQCPSRAYPRLVGCYWSLGKNIESFKNNNSMKHIISWVSTVVLNFEENDGTS